MLLSEPAPRVADAVRRAAAHAGRLHRAGDRRAGEGRRRRRTRRAARRAPQGRHRHAPRRAARRRTRWRWPCTSPARDELAPRRRVHAPRGRRRARQPLHRRTAAPVRRGARRARAPRGLRPPLAHAANSAGALTCPRARYDLVRIGIACYGLPPAPGLGGTPASPCSRRCRCGRASRMVKTLPAGARVSYGLRSEVGAVGQRRDRARRVRRRRAPQPRPRRRRGAGRRPAPPDRRGGDDGPAAWSTSATSPPTSTTRSCSSAARATTRSPPPSGRDAPRHHLLRDRHRHRSARAAQLPGESV